MADLQTPAGGHGDDAVIASSDVDREAATAPPAGPAQAEHDAVDRCLLEDHIARRCQHAQRTQKGRNAYTCPTRCVERNHPGREHEDWAGEGEHHPSCFQVVGVPAELPADTCDCRIIRMIEGGGDRG